MAKFFATLFALLQITAVYGTLEVQVVVDQSLPATPTTVPGNATLVPANAFRAIDSILPGLVPYNLVSAALSSVGLGICEYKTLGDNKLSQMQIDTQCTTSSLDPLVTYECTVCGANDQDCTGPKSQNNFLCGCAFGTIVDPSKLRPEWINIYNRYAKLNYTVGEKLAIRFGATREDFLCTGILPVAGILKMDPNDYGLDGFIAGWPGECFIRDYCLPYPVELKDAFPVPGTLLNKTSSLGRKRREVKP